MNSGLRVSRLNSSCLRVLLLLVGAVVVVGGCKHWLAAGDYDNRVLLFDSLPSNAAKGYLLLSEYVKRDKPEPFALDSCTGDITATPKLMGLYLRDDSGRYFMLAHHTFLHAILPGPAPIRVCYAEAEETKSGREWRKDSPCLRVWEGLPLHPLEREVAVKKDRVTVVEVLTETKYRCPVSVEYESLSMSFRESVSIPYSGTDRDFAEIEALTRKPGTGIAVDIIVFDDLCRIARTGQAQKARVRSLLDSLNPEFYLVKRLKALLAEGSRCLIPTNVNYEIDRYNRIKVLD